MRSSPKKLTAMAIRPGPRRRGAGVPVFCSCSVVAATSHLPLLDERIRLALAARPFLDHLAPDDQPVLAGELRRASGESDVAAGRGETGSLWDGVDHTRVARSRHRQRRRHLVDVVLVLRLDDDRVARGELVDVTEGLAVGVAVPGEGEVSGLGVGHRRLQRALAVVTHHALVEDLLVTD